MTVALAQLSIATAQRRAKFALQLVKVFEFLLHVGQLHLHAALHGRARLQAFSPQLKKSVNLAELESQTLDSTDEGKRFHVVFAVSSKSTIGSWRSWQQTIALVETNRVNTEPDLLRDDAYLHGRGSSSYATPWSIVQSQALSSPREREFLRSTSLPLRGAAKHHNGQKFIDTAFSFADELHSNEGSTSTR
ncbi:MAG TPA: hypothetical protein VKP58_06055 [Candidatus Acidoferrum sp.]|nr:hypothetical protein [Candidatus Acidoferrum sp.]